MPVVVGGIGDHLQRRVVKHGLALGELDHNAAATEPRSVTSGPGSEGFLMVS
ncbi:MAG: hypothetical protein ACK56I_12420 [bacterium]